MTWINTVRNVFSVTQHYHYKPKLRKLSTFSLICVEYAKPFIRRGNVIPLPLTPSWLFPLICTVCHCFSNSFPPCNCSSSTIRASTPTIFNQFALQPANFLARLAGENRTKEDLQPLLVGYRRQHTSITQSIPRSININIYCMSSRKIYVI